MARAREFKATYLHLGLTVRRTSADPWRRSVRTIRQLIRAMLEQPRRYTLPQVLVGQATLAVVLDPEATSPGRFRAITRFSELLGAFDPDPGRREDPLRRDPKVLDDGTSLDNLSIKQLIERIRAPLPTTAPSIEGGGGSVGT